MNNRYGFTLVELLAVIVILAIILAIAIPGITGIIQNSTKSAFEIDAKMVLQQIEYKKLEDPSFNITNITKANLKAELGLSDVNYESVSIVLEDNVPTISIVGANKWNGLFACGTFRSMRVVQSLTDCSGDLTAPVITILGSNPMNVNIGDTYIDAGATAVDDVEGNVTSNIIVTGTVNTSVIGSYVITYSVTDTANNESMATRIVNVIDEANAPVLATGMTPVKWNGSTWIDTVESDTNWYSYTTTDKKWANARTIDGSMWVWVPRYAYQIESGYHTDTTGEINIKFLQNTTNTTNDGTNVTSTPTYSSSSQTNYIVHPAFAFDTTQLTGIWVAKFEASGATNAIEFKPNVTSLRSIKIGDMFTASRNMETNSRYGWGTSGTNIDTHMMKNSEWGAIVYLAKSTYGKNDEIWVNNSNIYTTGCAGNSASADWYAGCENTYDTTNGQKTSTTGNIYGIYDMSGGTWELVSAYVNNGHANLTTNGSSIVSAASKYKDVYPQGATDSPSNNYAATINFKGDALYETSNSYTGSVSWFGDYAKAPYMSGPWLGRGGGYDVSTTAGAFSFSSTSGAGYDSESFRSVLLVGTGL